ncbi:MAG: ATP phosphoribosyltransferase [Alphaproteobacteria bacterium]|nr:ATP phosphoribosyltransferase [Alphaproteobacteria bacterium]
MTDLKEESARLLKYLRKGLKNPHAQEYLEGAFSIAEMVRLNNRFGVRDVILEKLADTALDDKSLIGAVVKESGRSRTLVARTKRAVENQYPPTPRASGEFVLALPKEERAQILIENIFKKGGFRFNAVMESIVDCQGDLPPIAYRIMRGKNIPLYVKGGAVSAGLVGNDKINEVQADARLNQMDPLELDVRQQFKVNSFRICMAVPKDSAIKDIADLKGKTVATTYKATLREYLAANGLDAPRDKIKIVDLDGGVEESCRDLGVEAIMDIVETGNSLKKNNLIQLGQPVLTGNMSFITVSDQAGAEARNNLRENLMERFLDRLAA